MNRHWVYAEAPARHGEAGHTHLVRFAAAHSPGVNARAICGTVIHSGYTYGDETVSGVAATCGRCLRIAQSELSKEDP
jgi:bacterioferritin-associated ferredoxin